MGRVSKSILKLVNHVNKGSDMKRFIGLHYKRFIALALLTAPATRFCYLIFADNANEYWFDYIISPFGFAICTIWLLVVAMIATYGNIELFKVLFGISENC